MTCNWNICSINKLWFSGMEFKINSLVKDLSYLSKTSGDSIWTLDTLYHFKIIISQLQLTSFQQLDMNCWRLNDKKVFYWEFKGWNAFGKLVKLNFIMCISLCVCVCIFVYICIESGRKCCWRKSFKRTRVPMVLPLKVLWMQQQLYTVMSLQDGHK